MLSEHREPTARPPGDAGGPGDAFLRWIERKRLQGPASVLLEMHRPLLPLAWPMAMLFSGVLAPFLGRDYVRKLEALRDPAVLDRVLDRLERSRREDGDDAPDDTPAPTGEER
ncbi:hypothetical protein HQ560_13305 [bacterium]|nr:hypothetical protein [bacterium]